MKSRRYRGGQANTILPFGFIALHDYVRRKRGGSRTRRRH